MEDDEIIGKAKARGLHDAELALIFGRAIEAAAIAEEREACAKVCEEHFSDGALVCADAIRARSAPRTQEG